MTPERRSTDRSDPADSLTVLTITDAALATGSELGMSRVVVQAAVESAEYVASGTVPRSLTVFLA
jgi:hypothetical protein